MMIEGLEIVSRVPVPCMTNMFRGLDSSIFKIGKNVIDLQCGNRYKGYSYTDMINEAIGTNIKRGYIKSSVSLKHIGQSDMIAWFAHFDGKYRRSGDDGSYTNIFIDDMKISEQCNIEDASIFIKKRSSCPPIRFVFERDPEHIGCANTCEFKGVFYCESVTVYRKGKQLIGESVLIRKPEIEAFIH